MAISEQWHDAGYMHDLLSLCGQDEVHICPGCRKREKEECPHRGNEPVGVCSSYAFDKHDPDVQKRVNEHIASHAVRLAGKYGACVSRGRKPQLAPSPTQ